MSTVRKSRDIEKQHTCLWLFFSLHFLSLCLSSSSSSSSSSMSDSLNENSLSDNSNDEAGYGVPIWRVSKPPLRSRPDIDFSGRSSTSQSDFLIPPSTCPASCPAPSHISGSTLYSQIDHSVSHKAEKHPSASLLPRPSKGVLESLTVEELYHNPHYKKLRREYDRLSETFTRFLGRELGEARPVDRSVVPDICQGVWYLSASRLLTKPMPSSGSNRFSCIIFGAQ